MALACGRFAMNGISIRGLYAYHTHGWLHAALSRYRLELCGRALGSSHHPSQPFRMQLGCLNVVVVIALSAARPGSTAVVTRDVRKQPDFRASRRQSMQRGVERMEAQGIRRGVPFLLLAQRAGGPIRALGFFFQRAPGPTEQLR